MQINNTIFEKKHYYMMVLREVETLKRQMEYEALNDMLSKNRLKEITLMWNLVFIGLLREGLKYQYIQNANNEAKDIIRLTIDNIDYNCLVSTLKVMLKDEYYDILHIEKPKEELDTTQTSGDTIEYKDVKQTEAIQGNKEEKSKDKVKEKDSSLKNKSTDKKSDNTVVVQPEEIKTAFIKEKDIVESGPLGVINADNTQDKNAKSDVNSKINEDFDKKETTKKEEVVSVESSIKEEDFYSESPSISIPFASDIKESDAPKIKYNYKEEAIKSRNTFVYDKFKLNVFLPGATKGESIDCVVAPLYMCENNLHPEIVVMMQSGKNIKTFVSSKERPSIVASFMNNEFLITGSFVNGEFQTHILTSGITASMGCQINKDVEEFRCLDKASANYGHCLIKRGKSEIHIIPLEQGNDKNGSARVMYCIINDDFRLAITNHFTTNSFLSLGDEKIEILSYWQDNLLSCDILN